MSRIPAIPHPSDANVHDTLMALKEAVEILQTDGITITTLIGSSGVGGGGGTGEDVATYTKRVDFIADTPSAGQTTVYKGWALPGIATSTAAWRVTRTILASDDDVEELFADGNANFDNVWDNRASLSYS